MYLRQFPCVALLGVRQCGKTTLLRTLPRPWKILDLDRRADADVVSRDPDTFFRLNPRHVALDEVQGYPGVFDALRVAIDDHREEKGRFVITGSSSPALVRSVSESLAGRVGIIEMAPLTWSEVTGTTGRDCLVARLRNRRLSPEQLVAGLEPRGEIGLAHEYWYQGGYPEPWLTSDPEFRRQWAEQYLQTYLQRDVKALFPGLDPQRFRRFLEMLGGLSGRILNYSEIARALGVSQPTVRDYIDVAHGTFVWRTIPAYSRDTVKRIVKHPRGYLRDSGLLHRLLRIPDVDALLSHPQMGASWEGMVIEEILRRFAALGIPAEPSFYRTGAGAEVDLIVETEFGRIAFEIKHSSTIAPRDLRSLREFVLEQEARVGIVIHNDTVPRQYEEKIIGVPFTHL
jgi:predicted AAA+ superfamily ATPase